MYVFIFIEIRDLNRSRLIFIKRCAQKVVWAVCSSKRREDHFFYICLTLVQFLDYDRHNPDCLLLKNFSISENYDEIVIDVLDFLFQFYGKIYMKNCLRI